MPDTQRIPDAQPVLLALDADTRATGWAIFVGHTLRDSGIIVTSGRAGGRAGSAKIRIASLLLALDELVERFAPDEVAWCQPTGLRWDVPALALLETELARWAQQAGRPLTPYPSATIRQGVAGHARASRQSLAFAAMTALGLVGTDKSTHEWEAVAAGAYHLCQRRQSHPEERAISASTEADQSV